MTPPGKMQVVQKNIDEMGQHLFGVMESKKDNRLAFVYTIGNALKGLPELLCIGNFPPYVIGDILNHLGDIMRKQEHAFPEGKIIIEPYPLPFMFRKAGDQAREEYTIQAGVYLGRTDYEVLQVCLCDVDNHYPGEPGCNPDFDVPLP